jgi:hypothetical protein
MVLAHGAQPGRCIPCRSDDGEIGLAIQQRTQAVAQNLASLDENDGTLPDTAPGSSYRSGTDHTASLWFLQRL